MLEDADTNSIKPTDLDLNRIKSLEIGGYFDGELNNWRIIKYDNEYILILFNNVKYKDFQEFSTLEKLLEFLNR